MAWCRHVKGHDLSQNWPRHMSPHGFNSLQWFKGKSHMNNHIACPTFLKHYPFNHVHFEPLHWRHNDHDGVSNHQPHGCLLNRSFRRRSKKTSKLRVTGVCVGNSPGSVNSPHKGPVTRKMFPFDDVIMPIFTPHVRFFINPHTGWTHDKRPCH